jgi:hypothetical protein
MLTKHLPYELGMLDGSFRRLFTSEPVIDPLIKNALIEAFWTHARNLVEFLAQRKGQGDFKGTASAQDFAKRYSHDPNLRSTDTQINEEVNHLQYDRESKQEQQPNGYRMNLVREAIRREFDKFQTLLDRPYRDIWVRRNFRNVEILVFEHAQATATAEVQVINAVIEPDKQ